MEVVFLKLTSGQDIAGRVINEDDGRYALSHVRTFIAAPQGMMMIPYLMLAEDRDQVVSFERSNYVTPYEPVQDIMQSYLEQTSGIKIAPAGLRPINGGKAN